jgi:hypothetical protein
MKLQQSSERGQVLVIIVFAMFGLIGITGLAIDGSRAYSDRRQAQNAADTAALAAALAYVRTPDEDWTAVGYARAASNGYDDNETTNFVDVYHPPTEGPYTGNPEYVQVFITSHLDTLFGRVIGIEQVTNKVQAVAKVDPPTYSEMYFGNAVVGLAPEACKAVKYQGGANTTITGGGIFVNSKCPDAAFFNNSAAAELSAPSLTTVGGADYVPGALDVPSITEDAVDKAMSYPPREIVLPNIACSDDAEVQEDGITLSPGNWSGKFPPKDVIYLESGTYCVNGDFTLNAGETLIGHDVVISMESGDVHWNGGATVMLDAPETGPFKGLMLYVPIENEASIVINGSADSAFAGTILAPASDIQVNGSGGADGFHCQFIGYTVDISGGAAMNIQYDNSENWDAPTPPSIELKH